MDEERAAIVSYNNYGTITTKPTTTTYINANNISQKLNVCQEDFPEESEITNKLYLYIGFILVGTGLIGNVINVVVFSSKYMRKYSSNVYIVVLAVSDSAYLINVFIHLLTALQLTALRCVHSQGENVDVINQSNTVCKLVHYFMDLSADVSSMIILCFTVERFIAVYKPLKVKLICTLWRTCVICVMLLMIILCLIALHHFMMWGVDRQNGRCMPYREWEGYFNIVYTIEKVVFRVVLVLLIASVNTNIIFQTLKSRPIGDEKEE